MLLSLYSSLTSPYLVDCILIWACNGADELKPLLLFLSIDEFVCM